MKCEICKTETLDKCRNIPCCENCRTSDRLGMTHYGHKIAHNSGRPMIFSTIPRKERRENKKLDRKLRIDSQKRESGRE